MKSTPNSFSLMMWQKPGLAWVRLKGEKQWALVARADNEEDGGKAYMDMARLQGTLRNGNYEKKHLDLCLKMAYDQHSSGDDD